MELETEKVVGEEPGQRKATRYAAVSLSPEELLRRRQEEKPVWEMILEIMKDVPEKEP